MGDRNGSVGAEQWTDEMWSTLIDRVRRGQLTPLLGAGASIEVVDGAVDIAEDWARAGAYPFSEKPSLPEIAQFVADRDRASACEYIEDLLRERLERFRMFDLDDEFHVYRWLTTLDLPLWLTTNYDDLIERGLRFAEKSPKRATSDWTPPDLGRPVIPSVDVAAPTPKEPVVFHLHGSYLDPLSMVITESDYLEFLERMSAERTPGAGGSRILPEVVEAAIRSTSLLFIGYGFRDPNLQLLLRQWALPRAAFAVQPLPSGLPAEQADAWMAYYPRYLRAVTGANVKMFWGTATQFCAAFSERIGGVAV